MIRPKTETEDLLLSITKKCRTFIKQTHEKLKKHLNLNLPNHENFLFKPPISIEGSCLMGLAYLEVHNSIFNITELINKFELYTDTVDELYFEELKDELEEILSFSNITTSHLQHEMKGRRIFQA